MILYNELKNGAVVQIVTDYALERVGQVDGTSAFLDAGMLKITPYDNGELRKLIEIGTGEKLTSDYNPSVKWPILIYTKTIKEIIILKYGEDKISSES